MNDGEKRPGLPRWWMDGSGPLAIGTSASLVAAVMTASGYGQQPWDGFGTLILVSLIANVAAFDNCSDQGAHTRAGLAIGSFLLALAAAAVTYTNLPA